MKKSVSIIGAGINGLLTAFLLRATYPDINLSIYDADGHPLKTKGHIGVTHGSKDARHITGSESIGFENSIHIDALKNTPTGSSRGWLLKEEAVLSRAERNWRNKFEKVYTGSSLLNETDFAHAELNYNGLSAWLDLAQRYSFIKKHMLAADTVEVYLKDQRTFEDDFAMESEFCNRFYPQGIIGSAENTLSDELYSKKLLVPGLCIRIKSMAADLLNRLEADDKVSFNWSTTVLSEDKVESEVVIWTSGVTHEQPEEYAERDIQGIVGCWITIDNNGFKVPFKIATPKPSAYINFTPDGDNLHISGGFGWLGEYTKKTEVNQLARPIADHFIDQVNKYLETNVTIDDIEYCVRPSTPSGLPLLLVEHIDNKKHIFLTGSAKSGATHAPVLSEFALKQLG